MKSLLCPFWWWNFLLFPVFYILYYWREWDIKICLKWLLEIGFMVNKVPFLGATWFLPALFSTSCIVHALLKCLKNQFNADVMIAVLASVICLIGFKITFPYKISRVMICSLFYVGGYLYNKYLREKVTFIYGNIILVTSGLLFGRIASFNSADMGSNVYTNKVLFVLGAFLGTLCLLNVSQLIERYFSNLKVVQYIIKIGKDSIAIVIWHFLAFRLAIIAQIVIMKVDVSAIIAFPVYDASGIWWILYLVTGIYGALLWNWILQHSPINHVLRKLHMI